MTNVKIDAILAFVEDLKKLAINYGEATSNKLEMLMESFSEENPEEFEFTGEIIQLMSALRYYEGQADALENVLNFILLNISQETHILN